MSQNEKLHLFELHRNSVQCKITLKLWFTVCWFFLSSPSHLFLLDTLFTSVLLILFNLKGSPSSFSLMLPYMSRNFPHWVCSSSSVSPCIFCFFVFGRTMISKSLKRQIKLLLSSNSALHILKPKQLCAGETAYVTYTASDPWSPSTIYYTDWLNNSICHAMDTSPPIYPNSEGIVFWVKSNIWYNVIRDFHPFSECSVFLTGHILEN